MAQDGLDEALAGAESAVGDDSGKETSSRDYASREYIQSYYSNPDLMGKLDKLAEQWGANKSELTRWLLERALELVEAGNLEPEWEDRPRAKLD